MSALVFVLKIVFLALLWLFIAAVTGVIRTDLFGRGGRQTPDKTGRAAPAQTAQSARPGPEETLGQPNPKRRGRRDKQAQLVVLGGPGLGDAVPLRGEVVVGRAPDATLDIDDDYASGHHVRFYRDDESWIVADLGSTNGTIVNGLRIARPTRVGDGDVVRVGRTDLRVEEP